MDEKKYLIQRSTSFSESIIWKLNENYYHQKGVGAWSGGEVPHYITSNATVGKTYAELIFAMLCDLAEKGKVNDIVYIIELGAGHGRLCFHILHHLNKRINGYHKILPSYTYVLTDIVEENLNFFKEHNQYLKYIRDKTLDVAYFDASVTDNIHLSFSNITLETNSLNQPLVVIANYFFDSIPFDLLKIDHGNISIGSISITSVLNEISPDKIPLDKIELTYQFDKIIPPLYENIEFEKMITEYTENIDKTYLHFPRISMNCIDVLRDKSKEGIMLLTMDKGIQHLNLLKNRPKPEWITHGSFSFTVNFHAFIRYCELTGGKPMFSNFTNFHLEVGCLLFLNNPISYSNVIEAFRLNVDDFGPDDYYNIVNYGCEHAHDLNIEEIIVLLRLSYYDSTVFENLLSSIKKLKDTISTVERERLKQTFEKVLEVLFNIGDIDLAFEMGGLLYDFGCFTEAIRFFNHSAMYFGYTEDSYYNIALSYYQLNDDVMCKHIITASNKEFPSFTKINELIGMM